MAILLAAGVGERLGAFTRDHPKCLLSIDGKSLLDRTLASLALCGVEEAVITVGHRAEQIRRAVGDGSPLPVTLIDNPDFREGSILSLWHARSRLVGEDVLLMDADVLYPTSLLDRLVRSQRRSCALLDGRVEGSGEEMILCSSGGRVWDIVRRRAGEKLTAPPGVGAYDQVGESVGFFRFAAPDAARLSEILDRRVRAGGRADEYEAVFPELFGACDVGYERVDDLPWTEIDFPADVDRAREVIFPAIEALESGTS